MGRPPVPQPASEYLACRKHVRRTSGARPCGLAHFLPSGVFPPPGLLVYNCPLTLQDPVQMVLGSEALSNRPSWKCLPLEDLKQLSVQFIWSLSPPLSAIFSVVLCKGMFACLASLSKSRSCGLHFVISRIPAQCLYVAGPLYTHVSFLIVNELQNFTSEGLESVCHIFWICCIFVSLSHWQLLRDLRDS